MTDTVVTTTPETTTTKRKRNQNPRFVITHAYLRDGEIDEAKVAEAAIAVAKANKDKIIVPEAKAKTPRKPRSDKASTDLSFFGDKAEDVRVILNAKLFEISLKRLDLAFMLHGVSGKDFSSIVNWIEKNKKSENPYFKTTTGIEGGHTLIQVIAPRK
jgi:hypothetical protein